jgi:hypothetical protein
VFIFNWLYAAGVMAITGGEAPFNHQWRNYPEKISGRRCSVGVFLAVFIWGQGACAPRSAGQEGSD